MDSVSFAESRFRKTRQEIYEYFKKLNLEPKYFIPISANQGDNLFRISKNMEWYIGLTLIRALNTCFKDKDNWALRLPVQDIYDVDKENVAVGKIISGRLAKGEEIDILPLNKKSKIKKILSFDRNRLSAGAPESIGFVLEDMGNLNRGQIICKPKLPKVVSSIVAKIFCVRVLSINEDFTFKSLTQETTARISRIMNIWDIVSLEPKSRQETLEQTDVAEVAIDTKNPVAVESFEGQSSLGRFVIEKDGEICAIGMIC